MEVEHCNIVWSLTESIEYYSAVPVVRLPVLWMKSLNDGGRSCSPNICLQPRQAVVWLRTRAASVPLLIRNVHVSSASAASSSSSTLLTPLPLLLLSGCWPVHFLVRPLSDIITSCCAPAVYIVPADGSWEMHLWAISENWLIWCFTHFPSLERVKIHLGTIQDRFRNIV